jgi:hypothetical protein
LSLRWRKPGSVNRFSSVIREALLEAVNRFRR